MRALIIAAVLLGLGGMAYGQSGGCGGAQKSGKTEYVREIGPDGRPVYHIKTQLVICGHPPTPSVLYGILNSTINYEWETLKQDFLTRVVQSVEQSPF